MSKRNAKAELPQANQTAQAKAENVATVAETVSPPTDPAAKTAAILAAGPALPVSGAPDAGQAAALESLINSVNTPPSDQTGGTGDSGAGPAGGEDDMVALAKKQFQDAFPFTAAAMEAWADAHDAPPVGLRIRSKVDGFRRAGVRHSREATDHLFGDGAAIIFAPVAVEALLMEPNLTVEFI